MPSHCSCYLKCHPVSLHKPYFKWHDSIFKFTTKNMGYSACFTIDVNMFWIFILFCFFPCSHKQLCLIKFLIFCTNGSSLFKLFLRIIHLILQTTTLIQGDYKQETTIISPKHVQTPGVISLWSRAGWRSSSSAAVVWSCVRPSLPFAATSRSKGECQASDCDQLCQWFVCCGQCWTRVPPWQCKSPAPVCVSRWQHSVKGRICLQRLKWNHNPGNLTWTCCLDGSWTIAVPFTLRSRTPLVPAKQVNDNIEFRD